MSYQEFRPSQPPVYQQTSSLAVISLIAGIASFFIIPLLGSVAAVITGNMAKKDIKQSAGRLTGEGMATAGMVLGWINIILSVIGICFLVLVVTGFTALPLCFLPFLNGFNF